ncbi:SDR family NAD(P)-dependent oxidoreductase, partial [Mesorhizobium sp. Cs1321R2N1]|uniref:SDR family NAD(P)-dependent oxidoreductase n=1 Tax=Mesorhizobium sp. Cs1321R2N1 TaxID=3015174 RepID=UPI00301E2B6B
MNTHKVALVTGANRGIGLETGRQLAALGFTVLLGARDLAKGEAAVKGLDGAVEAIALDVAA